MNERFARHIRLTGFGPEAQTKLSKAKVLIIGCGGLGCPAGMYLARSGVGHIGLVDGDVVQLSNLHRQVLFSESDVGRLKTDAARDALKASNSDVEITTFPIKLDASNWSEVIKPFDVVLDCSDNFGTRYLVNDACVLLNKPLVYGAANQFEGQVSVFDFEGSANLRDLFPEFPKPGTIQNCEEAGVLGVITGIIGEFMALETIKVITGVSEPLVNQMMVFDGLLLQSHRIRFSKKLETSITHIAPAIQSLNWADFENNVETTQLVDVRSLEEREAKNRGGIHIPLDEMEGRMEELRSFDRLVFYCQTGKRAEVAANHYKEVIPDANVSYITE